MNINEIPEEVWLVKSIKCSHPVKGKMFCLVETHIGVRYEGELNRLKFEGGKGSINPNNNVIEYKLEDNVICKNRNGDMSCKVV